MWEQIQKSVLLFLHFGKFHVGDVKLNELGNKNVLPPVAVECEPRGCHEVGLLVGCPGTNSKRNEESSRHVVIRQNFVDYLHFTTKSKCANVLMLGKN